jgi:N-acetylmuramoyl-L-alanine amidase
MTEQNFEELLVAKEALEDRLDAAQPAQKIDPILFVERTLKNNGRLAIVVGHTAAAPGAYGQPPIGENEYSFNKKIATQMADLAKQASIQVGIFFRDGVGLSGAYKQVNDFAPDAVIELHFNAAASAAATGTETLYGSVNPASKVFAEIVQSSMRSSLGLKDRGLLFRKVGSGERGEQNVNSARAPSVLVEPFFGSNGSDCTVAVSAIRSYVEGLVAAFQKFHAATKVS